MANSKKADDDATHTFPLDFTMNGDFRPQAEQYRGTIAPLPDEDASRMGATERIWVITNMKADGRPIIDGKVFVYDSGAIIHMDFTGDISGIAFVHIRALCAMAPVVSARQKVEKTGSGSVSADGGADRRVEGETKSPEMPPLFTRTESQTTHGSRFINFDGNPDFENTRGRNAWAQHLDGVVCVNMEISGDMDSEERVLRGPNAIARSEAAIVAWMEADEPWPGDTDGAGQRDETKSLPQNAARFTRTQKTLKSGNLWINFVGEPDCEITRGKRASANHLSSCVCVELRNGSDHWEERVLHGPNAGLRAEADIRAWMEAATPRP